MLAKRFLKTDEKLRAYYKHNLQYELYFLRWLGIVGTILTIIFIYIDYNRVSGVALVIACRCVSVLWLMAAFLISFSKRVTVVQLHLFEYALTTILFALPFLMDYGGGMPDYFLTNYLGQYFFLLNAALGHPFKFKLSQTVVVIGAFLYYISNWSPHSQAHFAQIFNVFNNALLSLIIAVLIERYKVLNFSKQLLLDESRESTAKMNELKTKLISMLSHDFVSPINNLTSLIKLRESNQLSEEDLNTHSKKIKHALENLSTLMGSLLSWSRLQLQGLKLKREKLRVSPLVDEVVQSFEYAIKEKDVTIVNETNVDLELLADVEVLRMGLRNFLSNAIKFSNDGDSIYFYSELRGDSLTLTVKDQGIGLTTEQQAALFTNKLDSNPGTRGEKGSGIGLIVTKDFAEMVGGSITVHSRENEGAEFSITVPIESVE